METPPPFPYNPNSAYCTSAPGPEPQSAGADHSTDGPAGRDSRYHSTGLCKPCTIPRGFQNNRPLSPLLAVVKPGGFTGTRVNTYLGMYHRHLVPFPSIFEEDAYLMPLFSLLIVGTQGDLPPPLALPLSTHDFFLILPTARFPVSIFSYQSSENSRRAAFEDGGVREVRLRGILGWPRIPSTLPSHRATPLTAASSGVRPSGRGLVVDARGMESLSQGG
ncbi:hypothetical protein LX36DRAFT_222486 [Colletotrichum falcatum]|nr:hypothetical protein LX36DRAFT_222486 [Colletotrichum falcatum]